MGWSHQYLPSVNILTWITISSFQHEEDSSHWSNPHRNKKSPHFMLRNSFKDWYFDTKKMVITRTVTDYSLAWWIFISSVSLIYLHHSTRFTFLHSTTFTFLSLPMCIFTVLLWWTCFYAFNNSFGLKQPSIRTSKTHCNDRAKISSFAFSHCISYAISFLNTENTSQKDKMNSTVKKKKKQEKLLSFQSKSMKMCVCVCGNAWTHAYFYHLL